MGIDITLREISESLAEVNAAAMIQLHKRIQQTQLTVEQSNVEIQVLSRLNEEQIASCRRIEAEYHIFRQEVEGLFLHY